MNAFDKLQERPTGRRFPGDPEPLSPILSVEETIRPHDMAYKEEMILQATFGVRYVYNNNSDERHYARKAATTEMHMAVFRDVYDELGSINKLLHDARTPDNTEEISKLRKHVNRIASICQGEDV